MGSVLDQRKETRLQHNSEVLDSLARTQNTVVSWWAQWLEAESGVKIASLSSAGRFPRGHRRSFEIWQGELRLRERGIGSNLKKKKTRKASRSRLHILQQEYEAKSFCPTCLAKQWRKRETGARVPPDRVGHSREGQTKHMNVLSQRWNSREEMEGLVHSVNLSPWKCPSSGLDYPISKITMWFPALYSSPVRSERGWHILHATEFASHKGLQEPQPGRQ